MTITFDISSRNEYYQAVENRVLVIGKDPVAVKTLMDNLDKWGYETSLAVNIKDASTIVKKQAPIPLVIIDSATDPSEYYDTCHIIRTSKKNTSGIYVIILAPDIGPDTASHGPGLYADDYIKKPYNKEELHIRINIGFRILGLQDALSTHICDLRQASNKIEKLHGLLSICTHCKKIRDDRGRWSDLEEYISAYSDAQFSHAICPDCLKKYYPDAANELL